MTDIVESLRQRVHDLKLKNTLIAGWYEQVKAELAAIKAQQGAPVGKIMAATGSINDVAIIQWTGEYRPVIGDLIYTSAPTIPEGWQLVRDGDSLAMLQSPDGRIFRLQQLGKGDPWGNADDNDEVVAMLQVTKGNNMSFT